MHVVSAPIAVEADGFVAGHKVIDTGTGAVTTTVEQTLRIVRPDGSPASLSAADRERIGTRRGAWDGPERERRGRPQGVEGLRGRPRGTTRPRGAGGAGPPPLGRPPPPLPPPHPPPP